MNFKINKYYLARVSWHAGYAPRRVTRTLPLLMLVGACSTAAGQGSSSSAVVAPLPVDRLTILEPLSTSMIGPDELLPEAVRAGIGQLVEHETADESLHALRLVCTRFVPGQVRFVLQPIGATGARDAAVHVFHDLSATATKALAHQLAEGTVDPIAAAAMGTVSRVTFVRNVDVKGNAWVFGGFDAVDGAFVPITIPRVGTSEQRVVTNGSFPFAASLSPRPTTDPQLGLLLDPVRLRILAESDAAGAQAKVQAGAEAARALESPATQNLTNTDCVSCHLAGAARRVAASFAGTTVEAVTPAESLRACGYVGTRQVVSERTRNETSEAAAQWAAIAQEP